jgi:hypothetical protein
MFDRVNENVAFDAYINHGDGRMAIGRERSL